MDAPQPKPQPQKRNRTSFAVAPGNEPKGRQMCFRATPSLERRIEERVSASGLKLADWLRQVVIAYLDNNPLEPARGDEPAMGDELEQGELNRDRETEDAIATKPTRATGDSGQTPTGGNTTGGEDQAGDAATESKGKRSPRTRARARKTT